MEYRGIKLADSVKLYKKDGSFNKKIKNSLDKFVGILEENDHEYVDGEYENCYTKILIDYKCGHEPHWISPDHYKCGGGCPKCSGKSSEQAKEEFTKLVTENGHLLLSEYVSTHRNVKINYQCGHGEKEITPSNYKQGKRCDECGKTRSPEAKIKKALNELICLLKSNGHEWIDGEYINAITKIKIDFKCGHEPHWITPYNYKHDVGCPKCGVNIVTNKIINRAKNNFKKLVESNGHFLLSEYKTSKQKVLINFNCGHKASWVLPYTYKYGCGCPICAESKGEKRVRKYLEENKIKFEPQKEFDGLIGLGGGNLSYDFYLLDYNLLIEYQGEYHDGSTNNQTAKQLEKQQEHDRRKREYAEQNNIKLLEIWYWDFDNVEEILQKELN